MVGRPLYPPYIFCPCNKDNIVPKLSVGEGQLRNLIRQKIIDSLAAPVPSFTRRDIRLPGVEEKAVAVIGMRRTGKTNFSMADIGRPAGAWHGQGGSTLLQLRGRKAGRHDRCRSASCAGRILPPAP